MKTPNWYITPDEFATVVVAAIEQAGYFKHDEVAHPEDIVIAFTNTAEAVALAMAYVGRRA